jgi:hypothetical protein
MSLDTRMTGLMTKLTAKERFLLELRAFKEDAPKDPAIRNTIPREQIDEFNRYVALKMAVNFQLTHYISIAGFMVEKLVMRFTLGCEMADLNLRLLDVAKHVPAAKHRTVDRLMSRSRRPVEMPWHKQEMPGSWLDYTEALCTGLGADVHDRWLEIKAVTKVLDEVAAELDGEDLLHPVFRNRVSSCAGLLPILAEFAEEPEPELEENEPPLTDVRQLLANARRMHS